MQDIRSLQVVTPLPVYMPTYPMATIPSQQFSYPQQLYSYPYPQNISVQQPLVQSDEFVDSVDKEMMNQHFMGQKGSNMLKKKQYADSLKQQLQQKKIIQEEKLRLENSNNMLLKDKINSNGNIFQYNMPIRDLNGNILNNKSTNKNYQLENWFTHLPNLPSALQQQYQQQQSSPNFFQSVQSIDQDNIYNNYNKERDYTMSNTNSLKNNRKISSLSAASILKNTSNFKNQNARNLSYGHLSQLHRPEYDQEEAEQDLEEDDETKVVRIVTPRKIIRLKAKVTQTPHNPQELNELTNQQITNLYPANLQLQQQQQDLWERNSFVHSQSLMSSQVQNQSYNQDYSQGMTDIFYNTNANNNSRARALITGDQNDLALLEKQKKRELSIELKNAQLTQIEEKKRQKELQRAKDKHQIYLDNLKLERELLEQGDGSTAKSPYLPKLPLDPRHKVYIDDVPKEAYDYFTSSSRFKKGKRPRTPIELARDPFKNRKLPDLKNDEGIFKTAEQKAREEREKQQLILQQRKEEEEKQRILLELKQSREQEKKMRELLLRIEASQALDSSRKREIQERTKKLREENDDLEKARMILEVGTYDLEGNQEVWLDEDEQLLKLNERLLKGGELPSSKLSISYDKSSRVDRNKQFMQIDGEDHFEREQKEIRYKLDKLGIPYYNINVKRQNSEITEKPFFEDIEDDNGYKNQIKLKENELENERKRYWNNLDIQGDSSYHKLGDLYVKEIIY